MTLSSGANAGRSMFKLEDLYISTSRKISDLRSPLLLLAILSIASLLNFWRLGDATLNPWDEALYGNYAFEMLKTGDLVNYYLDGSPNARTGRPPLPVWLIALSFKTFGYSEFSLRLPSALATVLLFLVLFRLVALYKSGRFAALVCLIAMSCSGIIGPHVGRSGDFDAIFCLLLISFVYFAARALDFKEVRCFFLAAFALGLAFYTKGPAAFFFLPGILLYALLRGYVPAMLRMREAWLAVGLCLAFPLSWYLLVRYLGHEFPSQPPWGRNSWQVLMHYDVWARYTTNLEGHGAPLPIHNMLSRKFKPWDQVLYAVLGYHLVAGIIQPQAILKRIRNLCGHEEHRLLLLAGCTFFGFAVILASSVSKCVWYIAPAIPLCAIITATCISTLPSRLKPLTTVTMALLLLWAFWCQLLRVNNPYIAVQLATLRKHRTEFESAPVVLGFKLHYSPALYLKWYAPGYVKGTESSLRCPLESKTLVVSAMPLDKSCLLLKEKNKRFSIYESHTQMQ